MPAAREHLLWQAGAEPMPAVQAIYGQGCLLAADEVMNIPLGQAATKCLGIERAWRALRQPVLTARVLPNGPMFRSCVAPGAELQATYL